MREDAQQHSPCRSFSIMAMCGRAGAYHVEEEADVRRVDGQIEIRVVTDDQRTLPTELESNALQVTLRRSCAA